MTLSRGRMGPGIHAASIALGLVVAGPIPSLAGPQTAYDNSLWIGTDNTSFRNVLNMDRAGALLRSVGPLESTGFAIDLNANVIYFGTSNGGITARDLTTMAAGASFSAGGTEDMTFDGTFIWRTGTTGPASSNVITKIDPVAHTSTPGFTVPFQTVGIAWDGSGFWVSQFTLNGLVQRFDPAGNPTGESFHTSTGFTNGGVAFDTTDSTLFVGTSYKVYHYSQTGTELGSFPVDPAPARFVDGIEFESALPTGVQGSRPPAHLFLSVWPNPSSGEVVIIAEVPEPGRLSIYDVSGRLVREMRTPDKASGRVEINWDGRDDAGAQVPSGVYFVQVRAGALSEVRRFALIH